MEQVCYYSRNRKDKVYNKFLAIRKERSANKIIFSKNKKKKVQDKPHATTRIRTRSYLSNIAYNAVVRDFHNRKIVLDIYVLLAKNLNPFSLERKIANQNKHEMIYMLWKECIPAEFIYRIYCYLNGKNVLYPKTSDMV